MKPWKLSNFSTLGLLAIALTACTGDEAHRTCSEHYSRGPEITACVIGASQVGPAHSAIREADADCGARYNPKNIPADASDWFDQASLMADAYNACHYGAAGHLFTSGAQDLQTLQSEGCVQTVTPHGTHCE